MRAAAACGALIVIGAACSTAGDAPSVSGTSAATTVAPVAVTTPATPPPPTVPTVTTVRGAEPVEPVEETGRFDFDDVAVEEVRVDTGLGPITWIHASHIPGAWLDDGFPSLRDVNEMDRNTEALLQTAFANAPCCLSVFPVPDGGWIGLGTTTWSQAERDEYLAGVAPDVAQDACAYPWGTWREVWHSADGRGWRQKTDNAFGDEGLDPCTDGPWLLAAAGRAIVIETPSSVLPFDVAAEFDEGDPSDAGDGEVAAITTWASDDLTTWRQGALDIRVPGMTTRLTGGVSTPGGWAIFGMRVSEEPAERSPEGIPLGPYTVEWAGWVSTDGLAWESLDAPSIFGAPPCMPQGSYVCGWIQATTLGDATVAYLRYWTEGRTPGPRDSWILWIGVHETPVDP